MLPINSAYTEHLTLCHAMRFRPKGGSIAATKSCFAYAVKHMQVLYQLS